jgi:hypothetical protein
LDSRSFVAVNPVDTFTDAPPELIDESGAGIYGLRYEMLPRGQRDQSFLVGRHKRDLLHKRWFKTATLSDAERPAARRYRLATEALARNALTSGTASSQDVSVLAQAIASPGPASA